MVWHIPAMLRVLNLNGVLNAERREHVSAFCLWMLEQAGGTGRQGASWVSV